MSSPLAKAIERAKACQEAGGKFVTSVSLDPAVAIAALTVAEHERRDFSNLIDVALAAYTSHHAAPTPALREFFAKAEAAHAANPRVLPKLEETLIKHTRTSAAKATAA